jgi:hypothetical protein
MMRSVASSEPSPSKILAVRPSTSTSTSPNVATPPAANSTREPSVPSGGPGR